MASESTPTVINHSAWCLVSKRRCHPFLVAEESIVEKESVAEVRVVLAVFPLLPVKPPEIHAVVLERVDDAVEEGVSPFYLVDAERNCGRRAVFTDVALRTVII